MLKLLIWGTQFSSLDIWSHVYLSGTRGILEHLAGSMDQVLVLMVALPFAQNLPKSASSVYFLGGTFYEVETINHSGAQMKDSLFLV